MSKKDEEKTTFHTDEEVFYYTKIPFGLKNVDATYRRLVDIVFERQMGRNLEAYVDDIVIKSKTELEMINDVEETLLTLKKKCTNKKDFHWTIEAEEAFQAMKKLIAELPTLTAPKKEVELMVYLSANNEAVSAVLLVERDGRQALIHYAKIDGSYDTIAEKESMEEQEDIETKAPKNLKTKIDMWKLYTDGASTEHGFGAGLILIDPEGAKYSYAL
uniref:Transposon Ty3-G Gag-Pol polyprotein n=1 Tax=Tanacetum cinerariifolium TaxID=118510 RepID=A0A6L2MUE1_TANCI|nr:transposon Ty3-G Gag-Pol polyprotein [Tanacetum cinerariifolium]